MSATTYEHDVDLALAIEYYNGHFLNVSYTEAAKLFYMSKTTLYERQKNRQRSIS